MTDVGTGVPKAPKLIAIADAIDALNQLWDDGSLTESGTEGFVRQVVGSITGNDSIRSQAAANSEEQFLGSPDLGPAVVQAVLSASTDFSTMSDEVLDSRLKMDLLVRAVGRLLHQQETTAA